MCLIVDASVATLVFSPQPHEDFAPVWQALSTSRAVAVYGGKLTEEYGKLPTVLRLLVELDRRGAVRKVSDRDVEAAAGRFSRRSLRSDDAHILGLAEVARVRLLCSHDKELHADFTDPALLQPQGSVYQNTGHSHLIRKHCAKSANRARPRRRGARR